MGSAFSPSQMSGLAAWWDFSDAATLYTDAGTTLVAADGALIYQANDKSGNGQHLTQTTEAQRPLYKVNIVNGRSVARADGTDDNLSHAGISLANTHTIILLIRPVDLANDGQALTLTAGYAPYIDATTVYHRAAGNGENRSATHEFSNDTAYILSLTRSGTTVEWYRNGTLLTSAGSPTDDASTFTAIMANAAGGATTTIDMGEVLLCSTLLSASVHNQVGQYLASKWGLTWVTVV